MNCFRETPPRDNAGRLPKCPLGGRQVTQGERIREVNSLTCKNTSVRIKRTEPPLSRWPSTSHNSVGTSNANHGHFPLSAVWPSKINAPLRPTSTSRRAW